MLSELLLALDRSLPIYNFSAICQTSAWDFANMIRMVSSTTLFLHNGKILQRGILFFVYPKKGEDNNLISTKSIFSKVFRCAIFSKKFFSSLLSYPIHLRISNQITQKFGIQYYFLRLQNNIILKNLGPVVHHNSRKTFCDHPS